MLIVAAALAILIGVVHSLPGEKYILMRLFRRPLPPLFGNDEFTRRTLRFAWHITTIAWWGLAAILIHVWSGSVSRDQILWTVGATFGTTGVIAAAASRG